MTVGDAKAFLDDLYRIHSEFVLTEDNLWANEEGTPVLAQIMSDAGVIPTRNWSTGSFEGIENINSDAFVKIRTKNRACYQCAIGCRQFHETARQSPARAPSTRPSPSAARTAASATSTRS